MVIRRKVLRDGAVRFEACYRDLAGAEHSRRFETRRDAKEFLKRQQADLVRQDWIDPRLEHSRIADWAEEWLSTTTHLKPNTRRAYRSLLDTHILPRLGTIAIGRLDQLTVRRFLADMSAGGAGAETVRNAYRVLMPILDLAAAAGAIRVNPARGIRMPRSTGAEMHFLNAEEVMRLARAIESPYGSLINVAAYTGLRAGEIGALRVGTVDLARGAIQVRESLAEVNGRLVIGSTKTYATRSVRLPPFLVNELRDYMASIPSEPETFLFTRPDGGPMRHNHFYKREFKAAVALADLPPTLRFHDLRHTCAALLIAQGAHPKSMQERLGHSTITVTLDRYGHLFPSLDDNLVAGLEATHSKAAKDVSKGLGVELDFGP